MKARTEEQKAQRKLREQRRREFERRVNHIVCEVWERSGIGTKSMQGGVWHVVSDSIEAAAKHTYREGIDDETWLSDALRTYKLAITPTEEQEQ